HLTLSQAGSSRGIESLAGLLHRTTGEQQRMDAAARAETRTISSRADLSRPRLWQARRHLRRRIHLQLAELGWRQHARQRRDPRLRLDPAVRVEARQVSLRRRRSILDVAARAETLGARA